MCCNVRNANKKFYKVENQNKMKRKNLICLDYTFYFYFGLFFRNIYEFALFWFFLFCKTPEQRMFREKNF